MFSKINAVVLLARHFDACVEFYRDTLGLKVKNTDQGFMSFDFGEMELALMDLSAASGMVSEEAIQPAAEGVHRALLAAFVENTDATYEALRAKGIQFVKPPTTQPWGQRTAYFKDPDSNMWEISHFLQPEQK